MDAVLLTWRWQNILAIWFIVIALYFAITIGSQVVMRFEGEKAAKDA